MEINNWQARFEALERSKNKEIEEVRNSFENTRRYDMERELNEAQNRYQNERAQYELEIKRSRETLADKNREVEQLQSTISQFSSRFQDYSRIAERHE